MSHTPGPWVVTFDDGEVRRIDGRFTDESGSVIHCPIALVDSSRRPDQRLADARLIAAAPELVEALRANLWCMEEAHRTTTDGVFSATIAARIGNTRALLARLERGQS